MTKTEKELIKALTEAVIALKAAVEKLQIITVFKESAPITLPTVPKPWTAPNTTPWVPNPITPTIICHNSVKADGIMKFESYT